MDTRLLSIFPFSFTSNMYKKNVTVLSYMLYKMLYSLLLRVKISALEWSQRIVTLISIYNTPNIYIVYWTRESERSFTRGLSKEGRKEEREGGVTGVWSKSSSVSQGTREGCTHTTVHYVRLHACGGPVSVYRGEIISSMSLPHYACLPPGPVAAEETR